MSILDSLASYWKLDESSGNASDATSSVRTLTNNGTTAYAAAKINNGADFGATNSTKYLNRTGSYVVSDGSCSFSFWVKQQTEIASGTQNLIILVSQSTFLSVGYEYNAGSRRIRLTRSRNNLAYVYADYTVTLGTANYYHVVGTYDGTYINLYVNGALITSTAASGNGTTNWTPGGGFFVVGAMCDANDGSISQHSSSFIDEVGVWSKALSLSEVTTLYGGGSGIQYPFPDSYSMTADTSSFTLTAKTTRLFKAELSNFSKPTTSINNLPKP